MNRREQSESLSPRIFLSLFAKKLAWGQHKNRFFSVLFWIWVVIATFWIETASVQSIASISVEQKYSQLLFKNIVFRQTNSDNSQISLASPQAAFHSESGEMHVDHPSLSWVDTVSGRVMSATSEKGIFHAEMTESALPSTFRYLILSGSATVQGANSRVDSNVMLFDNEKRLFLFPGSFRFHQNKMSLSKEKMLYDPIKDKASPLGDLVKNDPELNSLFQTIGTDKP